MAVKLIGSRFDYTLECDRDSDRPTKFVIRELSSSERVRLSSLLLGIALPEGADLEEVLRVNQVLHDGYINVCHLGLESAAPILDHEGAEVDLPIKSVIDGIADPDHVKELALAVIRANHLSGEERKKSGTPLAPERQD